MSFYSCVMGIQSQGLEVSEKAASWLCPYGLHQVRGIRPLQETGGEEFEKALFQVQNPVLEYWLPLGANHLTKTLVSFYRYFTLCWSRCKTQLEGCVLSPAPFLCKGPLASFCISQEWTCLCRFEVKSPFFFQMGSDFLGPEPSWQCSCPKHSVCPPWPWFCIRGQKSSWGN